MAIKMTTAEYEAKFGVSADAPTSKPSSQSTIGNAFRAGLGQMKQGLAQGQSAANPLQAIESGITFGAGAVNTALSPLAPVTAPIGKAVDFVADKISDNPSMQKFANSKAGEVTSRITENVSNLNTIASGATLGMGGKTVAKTSAKAVKPVVNATGRALKSTGKGAYGLTIAPEASTAEALMNFDANQPNFVGRLKNMAKGESVGERPITEADTAARHGLSGTEYRLGVQGKQVRKNIWENTVKPKLAGIKEKVNMKDYIGEIESEIKKSGGDITRRRGLAEALEKVKEDYKNVGEVGYEKLQEYKEGWAEFLPDASYKGKPIASSLKEVHNLMAKKAREKIYDKVGEDGKQAYIDYGNLKSIIESGKKSIQGDPASKSLSRDMWQFVMNKAVTPVATVAGKVLYRTGEGLEFVGNKGAKTVKDAVESK